METHGDGELISAYLDGELSDEEAQALRKHISSCPSCREEHASLRATKSLLACAPRRAMPPELVAEIECRLARPLWKQVLDHLLPPMPVLVPAGAFAASALVAVVWFGAHWAAADQSIPTRAPARGPFPLRSRGPGPAHGVGGGELLGPTQRILW